MKKKILAMCLVVALMATAIAGATLAYFTDTTNQVKNTFTVGEIDITLDEAKVDPNTGKPVDPEERVEANTYDDIHPGQTVSKDPTVTVKADSEDCYVRIQATIDAEDYAKLSKAFGAEYFVDGVFLLQNLTNGTWDKDIWVSKVAEVKADGSALYEFWYYGEKANENGVVAEGTADQELEPLFTEIKFPGEMTNAQIQALGDFDITFVGHAIQAAEFDNAAAAWAAWKN